MDAVSWQLMIDHHPPGYSMIDSSIHTSEDLPDGKDKFQYNTAGSTLKLPLIVLEVKNMANSQHLLYERQLGNGIG